MKKHETKTLLSFIIPVYNVEDYLGECIDSILHQITDDCEIILVNDGATDSSGEICRQYASMNPLVKVVEKENGGLSSARNAGLPLAKGEYVSFVDSDDRIDACSIDRILNWIRSEGADMCFLEAVKFYPDGEKKALGEGIQKSELHFKSREDAIMHLTSRPKYPGSAWAKLFRREFLLKNDLHFPYDRRYSEDLGFIRDCILCAESFDALNIPYYEYRQNRQGSITNKVSAKNFYDLSLFIEESIKKLTENKQPKDFICNCVMRFVAYEYLVLLHLYSCIPAEAKEDAMIKLNSHKWTLKYSCGRKGKFIALFCNIFGVKLTSLLMKVYRKVTEQ